MAYQTGTINNANGAKTLMDTLDTLIVANGYTLVETWTSSTKTANVYQGSSGGVTFYVSIYRASDAATTIGFCVGEVYDSVNHRMKDYVPANWNGSAIDAGDNTVTDTTGKALDGSTGGLWLPTLPSPASAFTYWASINAKRIHIAVRVGTTDNFIIAGTAENCINTTDLPNAATCVMLSSAGTTKSTNTAPQNSFTGFTREPGKSGTAATVDFAGSLTADAFPLIGSNAANNDDVYKSGFLAGRAYVTRNRCLAHIPHALLWDTICIPHAASSVNGDTSTIGAKTYVRMGMAGYHFFVDNAV